ncbi:Protein OBERON 3 [Vitis vinifera]|uniref:Protein OBERON 3 n=1 Tax=Vitis vinifera TaxID=29760 RepID=A0A438DGS2_VITVI|nr:Protein OBERON 3 [Vitis vinifera]
MLMRDKDLSHGSDNCQSTLSRRVSDQNLEIPEEKIGFPEKGIEFLRESGMGRDGFQSKPLKIGTSGSQELTLSYLCDPSKLGFSEKELPGKNYLNSWTKGNSSKREVEEEAERETREKKPKLETLNLSLALPDVSLSLTASNPVQNAGPPVRPRPSRSIQSLEPSNNNTQTTCSNDFTAASLSYSYSHPFSHNPSCSLTRNSTENYEYSVGREADQIWNCGEGTNGSVHSRFKPIGDGVGLSNHGGGVYPLMQGSRMINKEPCNSLHRAASSENHSFFPSELPARPRMDTQSGDSRGKGSEHLRGLENLDGGRARKLSRPERILREIVSESVPFMAQTIQELPNETVESTKEYLKNIIAAPEKEELVDLQNRLERRSDLTSETLSKCHKDQLDIFVAVKMGLGNFLSGKNRLPNTELVEIFLLTRCRNVNCKAMLPVDDCECKICSANKGFCRECMCPVCVKFDCANNTCSWVGCDFCFHWCHAACGIQKNLIKPDVFFACAKNWGVETLIKELDCVRKIFRGSEDYKGKELYNKAEEMLCKLESKMISPSDVCNYIIQFFKYLVSLLLVSS